MELYSAPGPIWKKYVQQIWKTTEQGFPLDDILANSREAFDFLQGIIDSVVFGAGGWEDAVNLRLSDSMIELGALIRNHQHVKWWFEEPVNERIVADNPVPDWMLRSPVAWWIEPYEYTTICQVVDGEDRVVRDYCADPHSGPPAYTAPQQFTYSGERRFTISTAGDWIDLVSRFPAQKVVRRTYDFELYEHLSVPNWDQVAEVFDIVTVTVGGYVQAAYLPLRTATGSPSMLYGWNPGESVLLRGVK